MSLEIDPEEVSLDAPTALKVPPAREPSEAAKKAVEFFGGEQEKPKETELAELLKSYLDLKTEIDAMENILERKREELIRVGNGSESINAGGVVCFFQKVRGKVSMNWQKAYKDSVGEMPEEEVKKYVTCGKESIRIEVRRI